VTGLLIAGTSSDAGKSLVVTGLCRAARRRGVDVVPYKAQNMSNNSMVCPDGSEIGRAQYLQAAAAGVRPTSAMNPVLLKPGTDRRSFIVVRGRPDGVLEAGEYATGRRRLAEQAWGAYRELADAHDLVLCEGAGSPAEINLRAGDYVNMGLAREMDMPVVLVGDVDRGGVLASVYGTWALLDDADRRMLAGYVINKFRGDLEILRPGLDELTRRTGLPCLGVLSWLPDVWLDGEDSLALGGWPTHDEAASQGSVSPDRPSGRIRVAVVAFPRISNATDVDALAQEAGVDVAVTHDPATCAAADVLVLPGSRSTVDDLVWLRERGIADVVVHRAREGRTVLGICGGYQMLAEHIRDRADVESGEVEAPGLGLLPVEVSFQADKTLALPSGSWRGIPVGGYEIHHGRCDVVGDAEPFLDGCRRGPVWGTMWHGAFESDEFRRDWLAGVAADQGIGWSPQPDRPGFAARRELMIDRLADAMAAELDLDTLFGLAR